MTHFVQKPVKYIVLCDFDGTITTQDISVLVLENFAEGEWRQYEDLLEADEINVEDCLELEFNHVKTPIDKIADKMKSQIVIREGFHDFAKYCSKHSLPLLIVSAGLDFIIEYVQNLLGINLPVIAPKTHFKDGITFTFPKRYYAGSEDFKADSVNHYKENDYKIIFIGDGGSDYYGAKYADIVFAVENKSLSKYLQPSPNRKLYQFNSFDQIRNQISKFIDNHNS